MKKYNYCEERAKKYLKKVEVKNKEEYFFDLLNIEHSFSGRTDIFKYNYFILEAVELIVNSIELFEQGYFDCAYYSLRQAIEISTTIVYLSDISQEKREQKYEDWKDTKRFPMQSQMLQELYKNGNVISDMKEKMQSFFIEIDNINKKINKYVHKQGVQHFYISRNHIINKDRDDAIFINNFEYFLKKVIGIVSVMRLSIDPYPILLMDKEILYRYFDSMTAPYSELFVEKYIDKIIIEEYKQTNIYKEAYNRHITDEKLNWATYEIVTCKYIDTSKKEEILKQLHLLDFCDRYASYIAFSCEKVIRIYSDIIMFIYHTDRKNEIKERVNKYREADKI